MRPSLRALPALLFQGSGLPCAVEQVREGQSDTAIWKVPSAGLICGDAERRWEADSVRDGTLWSLLLFTSSST